MNTYGYVDRNPLRWIDPFGLAGGYPIPDPNKVVPGGPWKPASGQPPGTFYGPPHEKGPRSICRYVPSQANGGPPGAKEPYWKSQTPGQSGWSRYSMTGKPITPEQAHPGGPRNRPGGTRIRGTSAFGWIGLVGEIIGIIADHKEENQCSKDYNEQDYGSCI